MKSIDLSIPTPCHENWDTFTPTEKGGFCASCQKEVIDFTTWSDEAVLAFFTDRKRSTSTCGRLNRTQLKTYRPVTQPPVWHTWIPGAALGATLLVNPLPGEAQTTKNLPEQEIFMTKGEVVKTTSPGKQILRGQVLDHLNSPMPGVSILLKGTTLSTSTDVDGRFELSIPEVHPTDTLAVSFIGYIPQTIPVYGQQPLKIQLAPDLVALTECTVIAGKVAMLTGTVGGVVARNRYAPRSVWHRFKNLFRRRY